eukprot:133583-Pelagomonas_calceolata.AAC.1
MTSTAFFYPPASFYMNVPEKGLEQFGWECFKVLSAHVCGKERGLQKLFMLDGTSIRHEFMTMKKAMHTSVNTYKIVDTLSVCGMLRSSPDVAVLPNM